MPFGKFFPNAVGRVTGRLLPAGPRALNRRPYVGRPERVQSRHRPACRVGDMASVAHGNNVVYFRYFEHARIEYFRRIGWWDYMTETGVGPIVASTQARFRRPVAYPDTLIAGAKVLAIAIDRITFRH